MVFFFLFFFSCTGNVSGNDSLFTVDPDNNFNSGANQETDNLTLVSSYIPVFIDEIQNTEMPNDTQDICGENQACKFDYLVTGKKTIALATLKFSERYEAVKKDVSKGKWQCSNKYNNHIFVIYKHRSKI